MFTTTRFDPKLPVKELLARYPQLGSALAAHGLDTCCGGEHPLEDACRAKGLALPEVIQDLESAYGAAEAHNLVPPTMSIRELRRRFPATGAVLERYGLGDCGGEDGPDEPLAWFATVHRLPLEEFLRDVRAAAVRDVAAAPPPAAKAASAFSPHFIVGSLFLTLTLGATMGMINLLRIAAGGEVPIDHRQIHGHTQVLGFAALFLMGIAYHALPRILGIGGFRPGRAVRASFWLMFLGVLLRNASQPFGFHPAGRLISLLSAVMEVASAALFIRFVFGLLSAVREGKYDRKDPLLRFVRAGTVYFALAMALVAGQGLWLAGHLDTVLPAALNESFYFAALYGFLLAWIYGFGHRIVSLFLGVGPARKGTSEIALAAQAGGVFLFLASWLPGLPDPTALALRDGGLALAALSAAVYLAGNGFLWRRASLPMMRTPGSPTVAIRIAFGCLGLWSLLELGAVVLSRWTPLPAQNLWWADAGRHVFTIGFLTLLIVGMSFRILPVFSGKPLWSPRLAHLTYGLILLGVAMRLLQYPAAFRPVFYEIGSYMGIPVVLALVLYLFNLVRTMRARPAPPKAAPLSALPVFPRRCRCDNPRVPARPPIPFDAIPILAPLRAEERAALDPLCQLQAYEKGARIFEEGDPALLIHFLFVGRVKIVKAAPERDLILEILGPGEPVGAVAVFERRPFPASAIALEPCGVVSIPEREFFGLIERRPEITRRLLAGLTLRLMALNRRLADMTGTVEYRAVRLFATLAERAGQQRAEGVFVPIHLSRQEIADLVGTTIETAIRIMSRWHKDGLVETEKDGFLIRQLGALRERAPSE